MYLFIYACFFDNFGQICSMPSSGTHPKLMRTIQMSLPEILTSRYQKHVCLTFWPALLNLVARTDSQVDRDNQNVRSSNSQVISPKWRPQFHRFTNTCPPAERSQHATYS